MRTWPFPLQTSLGTYVVGVDPGQVKISAHAQVYADFHGDRSEISAVGKDRESVAKSGHFATAKQFHFQILSAFSNKWDDKRRQLNPQYRDALRRFSDCTMKDSGRLAEYAQAVYDTMEVM